MNTAIRPESILKDLQRQWEELAAQETDSPKSAGVLRACAMTLIVACRTSGEALDARHIAGEIMRVHPSRAIIVYPGAGFDARVFAECWKPFGSRQQICSEGIEITAGQGGFAEAATFLVPLRVPDLPVVLWCRGGAASESAGFHPLYPLADKIVFDTQNAPDADAALRGLRRLHAYGMRVADLHWTRLTGWREVLAHLFDGPLDVLQIRTVRVTYGGESVTTCARYCEAWIRSSLPLARIALEPEYGPPGLYSVTFDTPEGDVTIQAAEDATLSVKGLGLDYRTALPPATEAALMQEELSILGSDDVYERVLNA